MASKPPKTADATAANDADLAAIPAVTLKAPELMAAADTICDALFVTTIDGPMMYQLAAAELVDLQAKYKEIEDQRFSITRPMDAAKKAVMALFSPPLVRINGAITKLKTAMLEYEQEEKRKAAIRQVALDQIAANTRAALEKEQAKQDEEARTQAAHALKLMESGDSAGVAEALTKAEHAQEMASALQQSTGVVSAATAATGIPMVAGITSADVWKAAVTDKAALLRYIADHPEYHDWVEFKMSDLHEMAKSQRDAMRVPGVKPFQEARLSAARTSKAA